MVFGKTITINQACGGLWPACTWYKSVFADWILCIWLHTVLRSLTNCIPELVPSIFWNVCLSNDNSVNTTPWPATDWLIDWLIYDFNSGARHNRSSAPEQNIHIYNYTTTYIHTYNYNHYIIHTHIQLHSQPLYYTYTHTATYTRPYHANMVLSKKLDIL